MTKKGRQYEIREHCAIPLALNLSKNDLDLAGTSKPGIDIAPINREQIIDTFPFGVECKKQNKLSIWDAMRQARRNTDKDKRDLFPMVATQCREIYLSILPENVFLAMVRTLNERCPGWRYDVQEIEKELDKLLPGITEARMGESD